MPAAAAHHPSHAGQSSAGHFPIPVYARQNNSDVNDLEPNEEWKTALHKRVEDDLRYMFADADNQRDVELAKAPLERDRITKEHSTAQAYIRTLAMEQYHYQLKKERNQRRWLAGLQVDPEWSEIFVKEQQQIMDKIKQSTDESPVEGRSSPPPAVPSPRPTSLSQDTIPSRPSSLQQKFTTEERKETSSASRPIRRPSDAHRNAESSTSHEPEERRRTASSSGSISRRHARDRSAHPISPAVVVEPEDALQMPPAVPIPPPSTSPSSSRQRLHSQSSDKPPSSPNDRMESSLGRSSGSIRSVRSDRSTRASPAPDMWKPSVNPTEDTTSPSTPPPAPPPGSSSAKSVNLGRRGSTASIRSTGSGASIRPSITETIPERVDGVMEDEALERDALQQKNLDNSGGASSKRRLSVKQEKRPQRRRDSKSSIPDNMATRHDEPHLSRPPSVSAASSSTFSNHPGPSSSATMQYATSSSPSKPSSLNQQYLPPSRVLSPSGSSGSFPPGETDNRYYSAMDRPPKSAPYTESYHSPSSRSAPRDREHAYPGPRDPPYSARPSHPPPQARSPYGDEREYAYSPMGRASEPISPFSDYQASHPSISHKSSFTYGREREQRETWDRDGYRERDDQHFRGSKDWDDDRDRMRERDRDLDYRDQREYEPRHSRYSGGPYASRPPSYPTPPSSAGRHGGSMEYIPMNELFDERDKDWEEPAPPPREWEREHGSYPYHRPMPPQNDDYEYSRNPDSASPRPSGPMRQPSYSRRESEETSNRRMTSDNIDNYSSRHPSGPPHTPGSIPIPRPPPPPPLADGTNPRPAWSNWATEGGGRPTLSYARSPPPSTPSNDPYSSPRQRRRSGQQLPPTYLPQQSQSQQIQSGYRDGAGAYPTVYAPMSRAQSPSPYGHAASADVPERQMAPVNAKVNKRLDKMERGEDDEYTDSDSNDEGEVEEEGVEEQEMEEDEDEDEEEEEEGEDDDEDEEGGSDHAGLTDAESDRRELILSASSGASGSEDESEEAEDEELVVEVEKPSMRTQLPPRPTNAVQASGGKLLSRTTVNLSGINAGRGPTNDALRHRLQRETEEAKIRDSTLSDAKRLINMKKKELERARQEEKMIEQLAEQREAQKRAADSEAKIKSEQMKAKKQEEVRLKQEREEKAARLKEEARVREEEAAKLREAARLAEEEAARLAQEEEEAERLAVEEAARLEEEERAREEARLEEERLREEEEARKEDERLEQERKEEERKAREEEIRQKELEALRRAEEAKKKELEIKQRENDLKKKTDEAKKLEKDAARKAEQAKRKETEVNKKEEATKVKEAKLKEVAEKTKKMQQEAAKIAEEAREKQANLRRLEEETRKKEQEIQEREQALALREEELRRREEEAKLKEQEANLKELAAKEKEAEAQRKAREDALYRRSEEIKKREAEAKRKEDEMKRKERESMLREEEEAKQKAEAQRQEEEASNETARRAEVAARAERLRLENEQKRQQQEAEKRQRDDEFDLMNEGLTPGFIEQQYHLFQQLEYAKREEEIKRQREERRRTDSLGSSSPSSFVPSSSPSVPKYFPPAYNGTSTSDASSIHSTATSASRSSASSAWSYSTKASSIPPPPTTPRPAVNVPLTNKPRTGSVSGSYPRSASPPPISETEWARRQEQFAKDQQERFQREQEKMEAERQMRSAGRPLSREDLRKLFDHHDRMWAKLPSPDNTRLTWADIPWPMTRPPSGPDDLTFPMISSYFLSPSWPETKSTKDRIKDHLRRWHPDRFETKTLPKVVDGDQERVKLGAGTVSRHLNELLRKENENRSNMSSASPFGD